MNFVKNIFRKDAIVAKILTKTASAIVSTRV